MKKERILASLMTWGLLLALLTGFASLPIRASDEDRPEASLDDDNYADLAIGVAYEDVGSVIDAGAVNVLYGSDSSGLCSWARHSAASTPPTSRCTILHESVGWCSWRRQPPSSRSGGTCT